MKWFLAVLVLFGLPAWANENIDTVSLIKQQGKNVHIVRVDDLKAGSAVYQIRICVEDCAVWEAPAESEQALADYVYLYALYKGYHKDDRHFSNDEGMGWATFRYLPMIVNDSKSGFGRQLLNKYGSEYACRAGKSQSLCVLHQLFVNHKIRRYGTHWDEGANLITALNEVGNTKGAPKDVPYGGEPGLQ